MKRLTVLAAALAAGLTTFAAKAESFVGPDVETLRAAFAEIEKTRQVQAEAAVEKADGVVTTATAAVGKLKVTAKTDTVVRPDIESLKAAFAEVEKVRASEAEAKAAEAGEIDPTMTASVEKPELIATARKASILTGSGQSGPTESDRNLIAGAKETAKAKAAALAGGGKYKDIVAKYASAYGVPVQLALAVISIESNYRANATGRAGEIGLMQIKPSTARMMGYSGSAKGLYNPETNIKFGMKYLGKAHELGGGTTCGTILRYNAGHGAKRMNPVSAAYCSKVKRRLGSA